MSSVNYYKQTSSVAQINQTPFELDQKYLLCVFGLQSAGP